MGSQILMASGRRPGCPIEKTLNVARTPPPRDGGHSVVVEPSEIMLHFDATEKTGSQKWIENPEIGIRATTSVFFSNGKGASCAS